MIHSPASALTRHANAAARLRLRRQARRKEKEKCLKEMRRCPFPEGTAIPNNGKEVEVACNNRYP